jgi:hydroxypyruvate isomerase
MYFVVFTASHEFHDCTGEDCKVCHELQLINQIEKQLKAILAAIYHEQRWNGKLRKEMCNYEKKIK